MTQNTYQGLQASQRSDFFNVLADLPKLPEGAVIEPPYSVSNPVARDKKTGVYYQLNTQNQCWEIADK